MPDLQAFSIIKDLIAAGALVWFLSWKLSGLTTRQKGLTELVDQLRSDVKEKFTDNKDFILKEVSLRLDQSRELATAQAATYAETSASTAHRLQSACADIAKISHDLESVKGDTAKVSQISVEVTGIKQKLSEVEKDVDALKSKRPRSRPRAAKKTVKAA